MLGSVGEVAGGKKCDRVLHAAGAAEAVAAAVVGLEAAGAGAEVTVAVAELLET